MRGPASGEIFGILGAMKESFETNLAAAQKTEAEQAKAFSEMSAAKSEEVSAGKDQKDAKTQAAIKAFWAKNKKRLGLESLVEVYNANKSKAKADAKGKKAEKAKAKKGDKAKAGATGAGSGGKASAAEGAVKAEQPKPAAAQATAPQGAEPAPAAGVGLPQELLASLGAGGLSTMPPPPNPGMQ